MRESAFVLLLAAVLWGGCGGPSSAGAPEDVPVARADELAHTSWRLAELAAGTGVPVEGSTVTLHFAAERVNGNGGVNGFSGPWRLRDGRLSVGPLTATRMMGPHSVQTQEARFLGLLERATRAARRGAQLVLKNESGDALLVFDRVDR